MEPRVRQLTEGQRGARRSPLYPELGLRITWIVQAAARVHRARQACRAAKLARPRHARRDQRAQRRKTAAFLACSAVRATGSALAMQRDDDLTVSLHATFEP
jgi:hypothetical protein